MNVVDFIWTWNYVYFPLFFSVLSLWYLHSLSCSFLHPLCVYVTLHEAIPLPKYILVCKHTCSLVDSSISVIPMIVINRNWYGLIISLRVKMALWILPQLCPYYATLVRNLKATVMRVNLSQTVFLGGKKKLVIRHAVKLKCFYPGRNTSVLNFAHLT